MFSIFFNAHTREMPLLTNSSFGLPCLIWIQGEQTGGRRKIHKRHLFSFYSVSLQNKALPLPESLPSTSPSLEHTSLVSLPITLCH